MAPKSPKGSAPTQVKSSGRGRRGPLLALAGLVVLLGAVYVAGYLLLGGRIASGTQVADVSIGGLTRAEAEERLADELVPRESREITLYDGDDEFTLVPSEAGLTIDIDETLLDAGATRSWNPVDMVEVLVGSDRLEPVVQVDRPRLDEALASIAADVEVESSEPSIDFETGRASVSDPVTGRELDVDATARELEEAFVADEPDPIALPIDDVEPQVGAAALDAALDGIAASITEGPISIDVGRRSVEVPPTRYGPLVDLEVVDGELAPVVDKAGLRRLVDQVTANQVTQPRDATVRIVDGSPKVIKGRPGLTARLGGVADLFVEAIGPDGDRTLAVRTRKIQPDFTTADARDLGITERLSVRETYYPLAEYRDINQGRAAELIDNTLLMPGDVFSFNRVVGERTAENGFTVGTTIQDGVFVEDFGGGVSQVATTTYNAAFFAGLEDVEHKPHSFWISRYPMGREATVAWGSVDLRFRNNLDSGVLIHAYVLPSTTSPTGEGTMHVEMWGTKEWDDVTAGLIGPSNYTSPSTIEGSGPECIEQSGSSGFSVTVLRRFVQGGEVVDTEEIPWTYVPEPIVTCS